MQYNYFDLELIGQSYDLIKTSFLVLDTNLIITYTNQQARELFREWQNQLIGKFLTEICKEYKIPDLVNRETYQVYPKSVSLANSYKRWRLSQAQIVKEKFFFLTDYDVTEIEQLHIALTNSLKEITGQSMPRQENLLMYANEIQHCVKSIIAQMPGYVYWKDKDYKYVLANNNVVKNLGFEDINSIIGKTDYDFNWNKKIVDGYRKLDQEVLESGIPKLNMEESVVTSEGKTLYLLTNKMPIRNQAGEIIGILGINIDITDRKQAEELKMKNQAQEAEIQTREEFKKCLDEIQQTIQSYKISILNNKLGVKLNNEKFNNNINLTKREREILYFLSINKPPKEIATILSVLDSKNISSSTVQSIIDKQLYLKFNVSSTGKLIEVATILKLIPFTLDN
ncbi:MAG: two-component system, OmpR family, aerobic respiration control sensor histidine kinase ArcB [Pseudomonadota bacterium]|nr:two-component system, OmpR family, aerobic respiration control sensor histidine kinase ArcB [Pseudomonadota bacterium]